MKSARTAQALLRQGSSLNGVQRPSNGLPSPLSFSTAVARTSPCHPALLATQQNSPSLPSPSHPRCFSHSAPAQAKRQNNSNSGGKGNKAQAADKSSSRNSNHGKKSAAEEDAGDDDHDAGANHPKPDPADAFNFADLESHWAKADEFHAAKLKLLRGSSSSGAGGGGGGGRFVNTELIEAVPVRVDSSSHKSPSGTSSVPLRDLAVIIPRPGSRTVEIRMHSASSRKAVMSAVQSSPHFNQQPQPDPEGDELVLLLRVEPERADEQARRAKEICHAWRGQVRARTARRRELHQQWKKEKLVREDDARLLDREVLRLQQERLAKIDAAEKEVVRAINARQGSY